MNLGKGENMKVMADTIVTMRDDDGFEEEVEVCLIGTKILESIGDGEKIKHGWILNDWEITTIDGESVSRFDDDYVSLIEDKLDSNIDYLDWE
jgi:hypothetical protein